MSVITQLKAEQNLINFLLRIPIDKFLAGTWTSPRTESVELDYLYFPETHDDI